MEHKNIRAVRAIGLTSKLQACNGDGAALTWDPISWYMELTTLSNRLMSSFWLKSKSCLAGWSANMVIAAGRGLLGEVKWRQTSQQQKQQLLHVQDGAVLKVAGIQIPPYLRKIGMVANVD